MNKLITLAALIGSASAFAPVNVQVSLPIYHRSLLRCARTTIDEVQRFVTF